MTLADATASTEWISPILQLGGIGGCLVWFMFRSEPRLRAIEASIDRMARAILLLVVSLPQANSSTKQQAMDIGKELDVAETKRNA